MEGETTRQEAMRLVSMSIYPNADVDGALVDALAAAIGVEGKRAALFSSLLATNRASEHAKAEEGLDDALDTLSNSLSGLRSNTHA